MSISVINKVGVHDLLADHVNRLISEATVNEPEKLPHEIYPIYAMPIVGGDYSLTAKAIEHRSRAVKISNGLTEVWLPRSQIRRFVANQIIVSDWIVERKRQFFMKFKNQSPQYAEWIEKREKEIATARQWVRDGGGIGFSCQMDGSDFY